MGSAPGAGGAGGAGQPCDDPLSRRLAADYALIECVQNDGGHHSYFSRPPLSPFSLSFDDRHVEKDYRRTAWRPNRFHRWSIPCAGDASSSLSSSSSPRLATSTFNAYLDIFVSALLLLVISLACFLHYSLSLHWVLLALALACYHAFVVYLLVKQVSRATYPNKRRSSLGRLYVWARGWLPSHLFGLLLISLPMVCVLANFSCERMADPTERAFYLQLCFLGGCQNSSIGRMGAFLCPWPWSINKGFNGSTKLSNGRTVS